MTTEDEAAPTAGDRECEFGVTVCLDCGEQRWAGTGPCRSCLATAPADDTEESR